MCFPPFGTIKNQSLHITDHHLLFFGGQLVKEYLFVGFLYACVVKKLRRSAEKFINGYTKKVGKFAESFRRRCTFTFLIIRIRLSSEFDGISNLRLR